MLIFKAEAQSSAFEHADSLYTYGEYSKAIQQYKNIEHKTPEILIRIAKSYSAIGQHQEALQYYENAILADPKQQRYKLEFAKLLSSINQLEKAMQIFEALALENSSNSNYQYQLGVIKQKRNDSTAIENFLKAYKLDKNHIKAINKIGRFKLRKRKYDDAIHIANKGLVINNRSKELTSLKAQSYYWQENYIHAKEWFLKRLELGEPNAFIYEKLSYCYARNYEHKKAILYLEKALVLNPNNGANLYLIGKQYMLLQDFINAEKYIQLALDILDNPLDMEYISLASILNRQKKYKEAIEAYNKALRHNPNNEHVHFFLAHTKAQYYKDVEAKIGAYKKFIENYPKSPLKAMAEQQVKKLKEKQFMTKN